MAFLAATGSAHAAGKLILVIVRLGGPRTAPSCPRGGGESHDAYHAQDVRLHLALACMACYYAWPHGPIFIFLTPSQTASTRLGLDPDTHDSCQARGRRVHFMSSSASPLRTR